MVYQTTYITHTHSKRARQQHQYFLTTGIILSHRTDRQKNKTNE